MAGASITRHLEKLEELKRGKHVVSDGLGYCTSMTVYIFYQSPDLEEKTP